MTKNLTHFKKVSLAFAITCAVAANVSVVHAVGENEKKIAVQGQLKKTNPQPGQTKLSEEVSLTIGSSNNDSSLFPTSKEEAEWPLNKTAKEEIKAKVEKGTSAVGKAANAVSEKAEKGVNYLKDKVSAAKDAFVGAKEEIKEKVGEAQALGAPKVKDAEEKAKSLLNRAKDSAFGAVSAIVGIPLFVYNAVLHNRVMKALYARFGIEWFNEGHCGTKIVAASAATLGTYILANKHLDKQLLKNITTQDAQNIVAADLIARHTQFEADYNTLAAKVAARGFATPEEELTLRDLNKNISVVEECLAKVLRSNKTVGEKAQLLFHLNK